MDTLLFTHPACIGHETGGGHPERPERLQAVLGALETESFTLLQRREAPEATVEQIARAHPEGFVRRLLAAVPAHGLTPIDGDTILSPGSGAAALRAAGAGCAAVDAILAGEARNAFCAVRPPGHHAETARAMGFCLFNNVAVAAMHARIAHGIGRIAVVDFDVHHGNGTQDIFWSEPEMFYASTHQSPLYPGTGDVGETGVAGNIVNAPLPAMSNGTVFRREMERVVLPALDSFAPELVLISAGFDAHARDPLAHLDLTETDFAWATLEIMALADRHCGGRVISTLEGGYDLRALALSSAAHVHALMTG